jgi:hypothetical protein
VRYLALMATMALAGCAGSFAGNDAHIYPCCFGQSIVGNEAYVTVSNVYNEMDALPLADSHCSKYGKVARFNRMERIRAVSTVYRVRDEPCPFALPTSLSARRNIPLANIPSARAQWANTLLRPRPRW